MVDYSADFQSVLNDFINHNIPIDSPGFYDNPNFINIENKNPTYLSNYAQFVQLRPYSQAYLIQAESTIIQIANLLRHELVSDGRLGACLDVCMVLSRILEREGIWNYLVQGALTLDFDNSLI